MKNAHILIPFLKAALVKRESEVKIHSTILRLLTLLEDRMFASIIFPQSPWICFLFWTCYCIDPIKAVPLNVQRDKYWIYATHLQHTFIVLTMLVDLVAKKHQYPSKMEGIRTMLVFSVGYNILLTIRGIVYNDWTYSFFAQMDGLAVFVAYVLGNCLLILTYCLGDFLNSVKSIWFQKLFFQMKEVQASKSDWEVVLGIKTPPLG